MTHEARRNQGRRGQAKTQPTKSPAVATDKYPEPANVKMAHPNQHDSQANKPQASPERSTKIQANGLDPDAFRAYVETAPDGLVVVARQTGKIIDLNDAACRFAQRPRRDMLGGPIARLVPEWHELAVWQAFLEQHLPQQSDALDEAWGDAERLEAFATADETVDYRFRRDREHDGNLAHHYYEVVPRKFPSESVDHVVLTVRDVTRQVHQDSERMRVGKDLLRIVQMLPDVVFSCEKRDDGKIYWTLNEGRLAEEFGLTTKQIEGKSLDELFAGGASDGIQHHFEAAFHGDTTEFINEMGGRRFKHFPQPVYGPNGDVAHVVGFISEVTSLVEAEQRIRELNADLEERIDELARANEGLEAFSYTVSHDLRTPLAVIDTLAQGLDRLDKDPNAETHRYSTKIRGAVDRMQRLIEDVLALSKAARARLDPKPCDLAKFAKESINELRLREPNRKIDLEIASDLQAYADPGMAHIVIDNLVRNAWKYTGQQDAPSIHMYAEPSRVRPDGTTENGPVFIVEDNGVGFDPAEASKIFQSFQRASTAAPFEGSGIGLATVARIVRRHGGTIWAESAPNEGARFCFTLGHKEGKA